MTPEYAAGFFDGEGTVTVRTRLTKGVGFSTYVVVSIINTFEPVIRELHAAFGGSVQQRKRRAPHHKPTYVLTLCMYKALTFLTLVQPFVRAKKAQVELALSFFKHREEPKTTTHILTPNSRGLLTWRKTEQTNEFERVLKVQMNGLNGNRNLGKRPRSLAPLV